MKIELNDLFEGKTTRFKNGEVVVYLAGRKQGWKLNGFSDGKEAFV